MTFLGVFGPSWVHVGSKGPSWLHLGRLGLDFGSLCVDLGSMVILLHGLHVKKQLKKTIGFLKVF